MRKRKLRTGFTTGTAAAAAAKAAILAILEGKPPQGVSVELLTGERLSIAVHTCRLIDGQTATCTVVKDAGDDPDVTHGAEIGAVVGLCAAAESGLQPAAVAITGGVGVGRITKPGLELPPGEPAINPGPRRMITQAVREALSAHPGQHAAAVEIFVPQGVDIAAKTLNARLGIIGGISILGTTGIVRPLSHAAFTATIDCALSVARATGCRRAVLTTGRRSERFAQNAWPELPQEAFVQIGDFFQQGIERAAARGLETATLAVFFGKALKMAQGTPNTHASRSELVLDSLAGWVRAISGDGALEQKIRAANTAREAFGVLWPAYPEIIAYVGKRILAAASAFAAPGLKIQNVIFDYEGKVVFDSEHPNAERLTVSD
jgi:cobalt-precorrin-5B (C1)-methyltransferase